METMLRMSFASIVLESECFLVQCRLSLTIFRHFVTPYHIERMDAARDAALGDRESRSNVKPHQDDNGNFVGGTAFERSERAVPVKPNTRAYTTGNSYQQAASIAGPVAAGKMKGKELDDQQHIRQGLNFVRSSVVSFRSI